MSYRSMGRAHDWDIEKYRKANKGSDKGNRRRFMKNFARIVKNPAGYFYWKVNAGRVNLQLLPLMIFGSIITTSIYYASKAKEEKSRKGFFQYLGA